MWRSDEVLQGLLNRRGGWGQRAEIRGHSHSAFKAAPPSPTVSWRTAASLCPADRGHQAWAPQLARQHWLREKERGCPTDLPSLDTPWGGVPLLGRGSGVCVAEELSHPIWGKVWASLNSIRPCLIPSSWRPPRGQWLQGPHASGRRALAPSLLWTLGQSPLPRGEVRVASRSS